MSEIEERVIERMRRRAEAGLMHYGVTLERTDYTLYDWLIEAQHECLDLMAYLDRISTDEATDADERLQVFAEFHRDILINTSTYLETFIANYEFLKPTSVHD